MVAVKMRVKQSQSVSYPCVYVTQPGRYMARIIYTVCAIYVLL